jgi:protein gp37
MANTKIEWTTETWNPLAGCSKVSDGCKNCYAIKDAVRLAGNNNPKIASKYNGTTKNGNNWTGQINFASEEVLTQPIRWTRPRMIFVNSMSDLFHENVSDEWIDKIFAVMALSPQHTFQILTKRADRMRDYFVKHFTRHLIGVEANKITKRGHPLTEKGFGMKCDFDVCNMVFPLPNVHLGVSVENQKAADERIPLLLETPAAVRWLSCEPLLGEVDLTSLNREVGKIIPHTHSIDCLRGANWIYNDIHKTKDYYNRGNRISWVVVGGESGNGARPCNIDWIRSIVKQCKASSVPVFVKQLGSVPMMLEADWRKMSPYYLLNANNHLKVPADCVPIYQANKKGADVSEFPEDLQIRQFPK